METEYYEREKGPSNCIPTAIKSPILLYEVLIWWNGYILALYKNRISSWIFESLLQFIAKNLRTTEPAFRSRRPDVVTISIVKDSLFDMKKIKNTPHLALRDVVVKVSKMGKFVDEDPNNENEIIREFGLERPSKDNTTKNLVAQKTSLGQINLKHSRFASEHLLIYKIE